jgi:hypothetical protein
MPTEDSYTDWSVTFDPAVDTIPASSLEVPTAYAMSLEDIAPTITQRVDAAQLPGESWIDTLQRLLPTIATTYQQSQLLKVQMDRAKAGLPPLDVTQYAAGVQVGLSPETKKLLVITALGLGGLIAVGLLAKRK